MSKKHLDFIRGLSCIICGDNTSVQAAHIRYSDASVGKVNSGLGKKPDDRYTIPLCGDCHTLQHTEGEQRFWRDHGINPLGVADRLYRCSGNQEAAERIINVVYNR
jgi:hypothetical protein